MASRKLYKVKNQRILFYRMDMNEATRIWARAGQYVDATHPLLEGFVRSQMHKVERVRVVPAGSVFHEKPGNTGILREMREMDRGGKPDPDPIASADVLAGEDEIASVDPLEPPLVTEDDPPDPENAPEGLYTESGDGDDSDVDGEDSEALKEQA